MEVARHGKRAAFVGGVDEPIEPFRSVRGDREQAVGNSTSGATTTGVVLLPGLARIVSGLLPPGVDMTELAAAFSRALDRSVSYVDVPLDRWQAGLSRMGLSPHTEQHVATMAQLHRDNRDDRTADGVERVTGIPPQSIEAFVAARRDFYLG
ncbi:hypothetical protein [Pseudonocardia sp. T1-2H]|uniref:hypothetical protein n=1 Tax=Pseudonocardia sp. T1-2H TaxID=3128899 RepID=UPI00310122CE